MAKILPIIKHPDPFLRQIANPINTQTLTSVDFQNFCTDMIATMYADDGIGLAAPQIGQSWRLFVVGKYAFKNLANANLPFALDEDLLLVNPELTDYSWKKEIESEGCLSVPGLAGDVERHFSLHTRALDRNGNALSFMASGYLARVLQHELDHLNGVLFIDRATNLVKAEKKKRYS